MSQSIIRTALTKKGLRLELEYREPAVNTAHATEAADVPALAPERAPLSDELRCFLKGIEGGELL